MEIRTSPTISSSGEIAWRSEDSSVNGVSPTALPGDKVVSANVGTTNHLWFTAAVSSSIAIPEEKQGGIQPPVEELNRMCDDLDWDGVGAELLELISEI